MRLREAFDILLDTYGGNSDATVLKEKLGELIETIDSEMGELESAARILYQWGMEDLQMRVPVSGPKERAGLLLRALQTVQDARLLIARP